MSSLPEPFDPVTTENIAREVVRELLAQRPHPLPTALPRVVGAGVYAIYYLGSLPAYAPLADGKCRTPIYVGKSVKARHANDAPLYGRLTTHSRSLEQAGFTPSDFRCRYLVLVPAWIRPAEDFLVDYYLPVWNEVLTGFGNKMVGATRTGQKASIWDTMHPGRGGAAMTVNPKAATAAAAIAAHFVAHPPKTTKP